VTTCSLSESGRRQELQDVFDGKLPFIKNLHVDLGIFPDPPESEPSTPLLCFRPSSDGEDQGLDVYYPPDTTLPMSGFVALVEQMLPKDEANKVIANLMFEEDEGG